MCKKCFFKVFVIATAVLGTISCSKDLYDEGKANENKQAEFAASEAQLVEQYKANFEKKYGKIDPNQTWDFSNNDVLFSFGSSDAVSTRAPKEKKPKVEDILPGTVTTSGSYYEIQSSTLELMNREFEEGKDHSTDGIFFKMKTNGQPFTILPIFMGESSGNFDLILTVQKTVDGELYSRNFTIWQKWHGIQYKNADHARWTNLWNGEKKEDKSDGTNGDDNLLGATAIQSKPITITGIPEGCDIYLSLKITRAAKTSTKTYNEKGDVLSTVNGYIKEYNIAASDVPTDLPGVVADRPLECRLLGCEDARTKHTDRDYNDVVFLLYGQPAPESEEVEELNKSVTTRYMIEDLGDADDRDFNDIVVDVVETYHATIQTSDKEAVLSGQEKPDYQLVGTKAYIRALGGTLDFELTIGTGEPWRKSTNMADWSSMTNGNTYSPEYEAAPLFTFDVTGFDKEQNNVSVKVFLKDGTETFVRKVNFSQAGGVPMIIATDSEVNWAVERGEFPFEEFLTSEE